MSGKPKMKTYDCLKCGAVYWSRESSCTCEACGLPCLLRPPGGPVPENIDCIQSCHVCPEPCEQCLEDIAELRAILAMLQAGQPAVVEPELAEGQLGLGM